MPAPQHGLADQKRQIEKLEQEREESSRRRDELLQQLQQLTQLKQALDAPDLFNTPDEDEETDIPPVAPETPKEQPRTFHTVTSLPDSDSHATTPTRPLTRASVQPSPVQQLAEYASSPEISATASDMDMDMDVDASPLPPTVQLPTTEPEPTTETKSEADADVVAVTTPPRHHEFDSVQIVSHSPDHGDPDPNAIHVNFGQSGELFNASLPPTLALSQAFLFPPFDSEDINPHTLSSTNLSGQQPLNVKYPDYTLPPLRSLPPEFARRGKAGKEKRKKDKDRSGASSITGGLGISLAGGSPAASGSHERSDTRQGEIGTGLNKWGAIMRANPVHPALGHAPKTLSTKDWSVAMNEIRVLRALERVEEMKEAGQWSFRQVRRQRHVGGSAKSHRDYLMDEMRWMRTDFREERKWKISMAFQLAHAAKTWHSLPDETARIAQGVVIPRAGLPAPVSVKQPASIGEGHLSNLSGSRMEEDEQEAAQLLAYTSGNGSDADDESQDGDGENGGSGTGRRGTSEEEAKAGMTIEERLHDPDPAMKVEEVDDRTVLVHTGPGEGMLFPTEPVATPKAGGEGDIEMKALKPGAEDPVLGGRAATYGPVRDKLSFSEDSQLFITDEDLLFSGEDAAPGGLTALFPDLVVYGLLDPAPPKAVLEAKKRANRKEDKDDPYKRADDVHYTRLVPFSQFHVTKPTLLSVLRPSEHWDDGGWHDLDVVSVVAEEEPVRTIEENLCVLFDKVRLQVPQLPAESKPAAVEAKDRIEARKRSSDHLWSTGEDLLLKSLCDRYPNNWRLICDSFNSSRVPSPNDRRSLWDCVERWKLKWGPSSQQPLAGAGVADVGAAASTRGGVVPRRQPSASGPASRLAPINTSGTSADDTKRRRQHHHLRYDMVRKALKARSQQQKQLAAAAQRKGSGIHETHSQFTKMPRLTPIELAKHKADQDARVLAEARSRRMAEEQARQLRQQQLHMTPQQQIQAAAMQQLAARSAAAAGGGPGGVGAPPGGGVPQIRNISQQTRAGTPLANAAANARMSPQQIAAQTQAQAQAQAQAQVQAHVQAQMQQQAQARLLQSHLQAAAAANANGGAAAAMAAAAGGMAHLSPPYVARAPSASSSPAMSQAAATTAGGPSPRPPSAQAAGAPGFPGRTSSIASLQANGGEQLVLPQMQPGATLTQQQIFNAHAARLQELLATSLAGGRLPAGLGLPQQMMQGPQAQSGAGAQQMPGPPPGGQ